MEEQKPFGSSAEGPDDGAVLFKLLDAWTHHPLGATGPVSRGQRGPSVYTRSDGLTEALRGALTQIPAGSPLPGERPLAEALKISRTTLRKALDHLSSQGYISAVPGRGSVVTRPDTKVPTHALRSFAQEMKLRGRKPHSRLLRYESVAATSLLARELRVEQGEDILYLQRLHSADGYPVAVEESYVALRRAPKLVGGQPPAELERALHERSGVILDRSREQIEAVVATVVQGRILSVKPGTPLLQVVRHQFAQDERIVFSGTFYRSDSYQVRVDVTNSKV